MRLTSKKLYIPLSIFILIILGSLAFWSTPRQKTGKPFRVGVSQCSTDAWRAKMNDEILRELVFINNADVEIRSADDNNERQIEDVRYFMENDFDIILISPNEADALNPIIKEAYSKGIPVVIFDRDIRDNAFTAFQGADNKSIGRMAAKYAPRLTEGEARVLEIRGLRGSRPAEQRHEGFILEAERNPDIHILGSGYADWKEAAATKICDSLLNLYPETNLIYAHNDAMAIAASKVVRAKGRDDIHIIGIDAAPETGLKAVADGVIDVTLPYPTEGGRLLRTAMAILEDSTYEKVKILPTNYIVDQEMAKVLLQQDKALKEETSKISWLKDEVDSYWESHSAQTTILYGAVAMLILLCCFIFVLFRTYWMIKQNQIKLAEKNRQLEEQHHKEVELYERLRDATQSKLVFFTNVSHDLRTPLTLISGAIEQVEDNPNLNNDQKRLLNIASKNTSILRRLVNELLDFRKYENGKLSINTEKCNLATLIPEWCESFRSLTRRRDQSLTYSVEQNADFNTSADVEKLQRVMFNLISNAIKYTPANGKIDVSLSRTESRFIIKVTDTGQGISNDDLSHIFERFYQVDKVHPNGSGLGLTLAKAFVELHGGTLDAESEPGKGSTFTITLPVHVADIPDSAADSRQSERHEDTQRKQQFTELISSEMREIPSDREEQEENSPEEERQTILVIDDNQDIRDMLTTLFKGEYRVLTAPDGTAGIKIAAKYVPDLIICDIMMPGMDGIECCRILKNEQATSHIPVLMLTACSMDEQRVSGYESGADGYISKPFNPKVLVARCHSLIENRRRIRRLLPFPEQETHERPDTTAAEVSPTRELGEIDNDFYRSFCDIVKEEMSNPELSVDGIATRMGLSRTQFYRKIKALTNYSPVTLLRNMRLAKGRQLLTSSDKTVSEIAYSVGYSSPAYFCKCYKDRYGEKPTDIRDSISRQE